MCMHQSKRALSTAEPSPEFTLGNNDDPGSEYVDTTKRINSDEKDLRVLHLNIRGLASKKNDLLHLIENSFHNHTPDVITLCETWLTDNSPNITIPGYQLYSTNRTHKMGGGVAVLISAGILSRQLVVQSHNTNQEHCFVEIKTPTKPIIIGSIYRPPNTNANEFTNWLRDTIKLLDPTSDIIIGLDHNMDFLKSERHRPTQEFIHTILDEGLMPTITQPTRLSHTTATLIDNILINQKSNENYDSYILIDNISDHLPCACVLRDVKICKRDTRTIVSRDMKRINMNRLKEEVTNYDWTSITGSEEHIDMKTEKLISKLNDDINHFLPYRTRRISFKQLRKEPWITPALMKSIRRGKILYKQQLHGNTIMQIKYKEYNTILKKVKRHAKKQYYIDKCTEYKSNTKQLWKTINRIVGRTNDKSTVINELIANTTTIRQPSAISNHLCTYFSNVGKNFADKIPRSKKSINDYLSMIRMNKESVYYYPTTRQEIIKIINGLPNKKSSGHDNIDNVLLKEISSGLIDALEQLFNESLQTGVFPDIFKLAEVVPLYKGKE